MRTHTSVVAGIFLGFGLLSPLQSQGHGEDKPGPHGGNVRMPGAFHTELLKSGDSEFSVYLLDINWKNPTTKNSALSAVLQPKGANEGAKQIQCKPQKTSQETSMKTAFVCLLPKNLKWSELQTITLKPKRDGQVGIDMPYQLPLQFGPQQ